MATATLKYSEFTPKVNYKSNRKHHILWVISHIRRYWFLFSFVILFTILNSIFQSLVPNFIGQIFGLYDENLLTLQKLGSLSLLVLIFGVGAGIFQLLRSWTLEFVSQRIERNVRDELYSTLLGKSLTFHDGQRIGDLMTRATTDVRQINIMLNPGFNLVFQSIVGIIIPILFISFINIQLAIVPVLYIIIFVFVLRRYNDALAPYAMKTRIASSKTQSRLNEAISGMHVIRGSAREDKEQEIFEKNIMEFRDAQVKLGELQAMYWPLLIFGVATALAILHGVLLQRNGVIDVKELIQFILLVQLLRFPTFINIFAITVLTLGVSSARRILELIEGESEIDMNINGNVGEIEGLISFEDVTFGYNSNHPVLKNISFTVKPGQTVALVGMTGAGKTTITKLLARLYEPTSGKVLVDGVNLKDWSIQSLREQMAVVEQDVFLFSKSIRDNILLGNPSATQQEVEEAAKLAHAHEFILETKDGYDTVIGERGVTLSGGQRQRLAIARAVLKNPKILMLDDASSAIDSKTEDEINQAIKGVLQNRVAFLITHRIAQIRRADLIILMDQGKIIDMGTHNELLKTSTKYKEIFSIYDDFDARSTEVDN